MSWAKRHGGVLIVVAALVLLYSQLPLGKAVEFGQDEGFELMKGFLCSKGFVLYKQIWSDQPPVFTLLLNGAFKLWEPTIGAARFVAAGFGVILFAAFYHLVRQGSGNVSAALATFFLIASPLVLLLSVSVMQEVPAISTALVSAALVFRWRKRPRWIWLLGAGAVMGLALGIKLTAMLVTPAILMEIALYRRNDCKPAWLKQTALDALLWSAGALATFAMIILVWGDGSFESSWKAHFAPHRVPGMAGPEDFPMPVSLFWDHAEGTAAAVLGLALLAWRRRWREFAFPIVLLATSLAVHTLHRPWWTFYYLHLAVPMAWLAGFAASAVIQAVSRFLSSSRFRLSSPATWKGIALCGLIALGLTRSLGRLEAGVKDLRQRTTANAHPVVARMKQHADRTRWVYAENPIYPFHAGLCTPPELAVVTLKRFWSEQITTREIVEICRRYRPEQLHFGPARIGEEWEDFLKEYSVGYRDKSCALYVVKRIEQLEADITKN